MSSDFEFDEESIMRRALVAWGEVLNDVESAAVEAISLVRYEHPNETVRRNGEIVGSPRDKVDTGNLIESQRMERVNEEVAELINDAEYSLLVHEGHGRTPSARWYKEAIAGDQTGDPDWINPRALVNVPEAFKREFNLVR